MLSHSLQSLINVLPDHTHSLSMELKLIKKILTSFRLCCPCWCPILTMDAPLLIFLLVLAIFYRIGISYMGTINNTIAVYQGWNEGQILPTEGSCKKATKAL